MRLTPEILLRAYASGVFPMAEGRDDPTLHWIDPDTRGVLPLDKFHVSRRLARKIRQNAFHVTADQAFLDVIQSCAAPARGRKTTWINDEIIALYSGLAKVGHSHSVEAWNHKGHLVGGLYGVSLGAAFFGESMFSTETDASKVALAHLVARLRAGKFTLLDTQFVTDHLATFGAVEIPREAYHAQLAAAMQQEADFYSLPERCDGADAMQSIGQTS